MPIGSFLKNVVRGREPDPVREVLCELLGSNDFVYDMLVAIGLERRFEVRQGETTVYLTLLAYNDDCRLKLTQLEERCGENEAAPKVLAWKECEPRLHGRPYILADRPV